MTLPLKIRFFQALMLPVFPEMRVLTTQVVKKERIEVLERQLKSTSQDPEVQRNAGGSFGKIMYRWRYSDSKPYTLIVNSCIKLHKYFFYY